MPTRREAARFKAANDELADKIGRVLRRTWASMGAATPQEKRDVLLDVVPGLVGQFGDVAGVIAADYFEATTGLAATVVDADLDAASGSVRALAGGLFDGRESQAFGLIVSSATRHMLQVGRSTMYESARRSPGLSYARVPEPGACNWCLMLAGRGAVYATRSNAGGEGNDYHDECGCQPTAVRDNSELPYDHDALYEKYLTARRATIEGAPTGMSDADIAARMRILYGGN